MRLSDLNGKRVCILGFGKEGKAMLEALQSHVPDAVISIADANPVPVARNSKLEAHTGNDYLQKADGADIIIKSPGVKPDAMTEMWRQQDRLTSGTELFLEEALAQGATVIGVTGSKGKSTTSSLIHAMLPGSHLIGNIGTPAISLVDKIKPTAVFVMEMSSYQLMDVTVSPQIAVVTSFFPDHLDYHGSLDAYREAKANIARFQTTEDKIFYAKDSPGAVWIAKQSHGKRVPFLPEECPVAISSTHLIGEHNRGNIAGAYKAALEAGADAGKALDAIRSFEPLPHRLQSLGVHGGIEWIDDAISTTPESTIAALDALGERVRTIILGGQDRGYDFEQLAIRLAQSDVETAILFPGSGPAIRKAIDEAGAQIHMIDAATMEEAVAAAKKNTSIPSPSPSPSLSPIVLLSCASPSYNLFKNFEEKGELFKKFALEE